MTAVVLGLVAVVAAIVLVVVALADPRGADQRTMARLVTAHGEGGVTAGDERSGPRFREALLDLARRIAARSPVSARLALRLDRAGSTQSVEEWLVLVAGIVVGGTVLLSLLLGPVGGILLGVPLGLLGPHLYLSVATTRRRARFSDDLPDALQLVASGLATGYSLPQALDAVVTLGDGPISVEVGRALAQARLGTSVEDALATVAERMGSVDFEWIVMAIRIQRDVGGNLGEILLSVAATIRERSWLRRHVAALAAEGKLSGWILGGLPVALGGYMGLVQPDYIGRLFTQPLGLVMIGVGLVLLALGALWMRSIVRIEL